MKGFSSKILMVMCQLLFTFSSIVYSQSGAKIIGKVIDDKTNEPIVGCNVLIEELMIGDATSLDGEFILLNIPPGTYNVIARMVGYKAQVVEGVQLYSGLTTEINFNLGEEAIEMSEVEVIAYRTPPVQKDLTSKLQARTSEEISQTPISTVKDILTQQAGIVRQTLTRPVTSLPVFGLFNSIPTDGLHFRGGRENETSYLLDGVNVSDALWGGYGIDQLGELLISSIETFTGTFAPQYGEAMSGVVQVSSFDNINIKPKFGVKAFSDKHGIDAASDNTYSYEFFLSSAVPFYENLGFVYSHRTYSTDGYIFGYIYPEYKNSEGTDKSGTPEEVPMQYSDTEFNFAKLLWKPSSKFKVSVGGYISKSNKGVYNHYFKYNPYGTPRVRLKDNLAYGKINYFIDDKSYLDLSLANYERKFISGVFDNPAFYDITPEYGGGEFSISGEDYVHFNTFFGRKELKLSYVNQINEMHNLAVGVSYELLKTDLARKNPSGGTALELYAYKPYQIHGFINEKMEFSDMGLIINLGARFDHINPNRKVLQDIREISDLTATLKESKAETYITPRLGISFPVADRAALRFGYGHYYQFPNYFKVFQGTYLVEASGEYRPNPQLEVSPIAATEIEAEKTINYEFGVQMMVSPSVSFDVTSFYRKTSNLIGIALSETNEGKRFQVMDNIDYATVKGIEFSLKKHFSDNFSAFFNYTLSKTLVSTSILFERPTDEARTFPANWDQPHVFQGNLHFLTDFGLGFSLYGSISSGYPYTRTTFDPNGERGPSIHQLDLNIFKNFTYIGTNLQVFIQILNVTNDRNIWWVYSDSGIAGEDANEATSYDYTNNPTMYGPGRKIQFGIKIWN